MFIFLRQDMYAMYWNNRQFQMFDLTPPKAIDLLNMYLEGIIRQKGRGLK